MAVQLRRAGGIERKAFHVQTGFGLDAIAGEKMQSLIEQGLLADSGDGVCLTRRGK